MSELEKHPLDENLSYLHELSIRFAMSVNHEEALKIAKAYEDIQNFLIREGNTKENQKRKEKENV